MPFRGTSVVHPLYPCVDEPIPMRQPPTGEPCAGEPHARFGGRGRRKPFPTPIGLRGGNSLNAASCGELTKTDRNIDRKGSPFETTCSEQCEAGYR